MLQHGAPVRVISASAPKNTSQLATLHLSLAATAVAAGWTDELGRAGNVSRHLVLEKGKVTQPGHARRPAVGRSAPQLQPAKPARPSATASSCFPQLISRDLNYFCTQHHLQPLPTGIKIPGFRFQFALECILGAFAIHNTK